MTRLIRRVLYPDGGFMLNGHIWEVGRPAGWLTFEKRPVFVELDPDFRESAILYSDRERTRRLGYARKGPAL